jgi:crotonobetainyl-CoA:carnitine CoA-transferase CaiB-like acyl-CoA transferase
MTAKGGPLAGIKIIEMAGIGPAPMCGMLLSDLGAEILRIDRPAQADVGINRPLETNFILRGRNTIKLDLKQPDAVALVRRLVRQADALIEGFRPGVMERLGIGPDVCLKENPRLIYGRVTGWGQNGRRSKTAGHDINYIALTGALGHMGRKGEAPPIPLNLIGDFAGGALFLAVGLLAGIIEARYSGQGQVVDAAIVDGVASMLTSINGLLTCGLFSPEPGTNILDSGAFYYDTYLCADGRYIAVGCIEKRFFAQFLELLGIDPSTMPPQDDRDRWPEGREQLRKLFLTRTRDEWAKLFEGTDACVTPVLSLSESFEDPHLRERGTYMVVGGYQQAAPAPRFSRTQPTMPSPPAPPASEDALRGWLSPQEIEALRSTGLLQS